MTKKSSVELAIQPQRMLVAHQGQQGAALIVVLLILILIMLVGTMAVRQSTTNLKVATSDQINTLLLQSADGAKAREVGEEESRHKALEDVVWVV